MTNKFYIRKVDKSRSKPFEKKFQTWFINSIDGSNEKLLKIIIKSTLFIEY